MASGSCSSSNACDSKKFTSCSSSNACDSKKFTSNIWTFFDRIKINLENNKKEIKSKCKICNKLLSGGSNVGISHLKRYH